jgi:hypothetical protein
MLGPLGGGVLESDLAATQSRTAAGRLRRMVFGVLVAVFALAHFFLTPLPFALLGWFIEEEGIQSHRVHEICFGMAFVLSLAGLVMLLRRPDRKLAQMYQVAITLWLLAAAYIVVDRAFDPIVLFFVVVPALLIWLHPGRALLIRPPLNLKPALVALAIAAALPLLVFAAREFGTGFEASRVAPEALESVSDDASQEEVDQVLREATGSREEFEAARHYGHWSAMGGFALSIVALAGIAALGVPGWGLSAWSSGLAAIGYGIVSLVFPEDASAALSAWAVLSIVWGVAFIVVGQVERRRTRGLRPPSSGDVEPEAAS